MKIYLGSDHGAFELKEYLKQYLQAQNYELVDEGCHSIDSVDYPDIAKKLCKDLLQENNAIGILLCGTGLGMSISANKINGIRAALCTNEYMAQMAKEHNDANILCLGGRVLGFELAKSIVNTFLDTSFSRDIKHIRRIKKI